MSIPPQVMVVYGTRPEAIKVAPVIRALQDDELLQVHVVTTAQHREMLDQVHETFGITPDFDLNIMSTGQSLADISTRATLALDALFRSERPDVVLVQGDTTTVVAAAIAAFQQKIPVAHLEAGLRSGDLSSPFPEEGNRRIVSHIASAHLAPTESARTNLRAEGIPDVDISVTGNTVTDALKWAVAQPVRFSDPRLAQLIDSRQPVITLTTHRRENLGNPMKRIGSSIAEIAEAFPDHTIVWPAHKNPAVRSELKPLLEARENVLIAEPLTYLEFTHLLKRSRVILTDSGGIQEEAPTLDVPVLVLRENTERPEGIEAGAVKLVGTDPARIVTETSRLLSNGTVHAAMASASNPYGDGKTAARCLAAIHRLLRSHV